MKKTLLNALAWLTGVSKSVLTFILPILAQSTAMALETLLPSALGIVTSLSESNDLSGEEKRRQAVKELQAAAIRAGVNASASALNLAVELAVQKLKEAQ